MEPSKKFTSTRTMEHKRHSVDWRPELSALCQENEPHLQTVGRKLHVHETPGDAKTPYEGELYMLRYKNTLLAEALRAWKDNHFRRQPENHAPHSALAKQYASLNILVCDWVEDVLDWYLEYYHNHLWPQGGPPKLYQPNDYYHNDYPSAQQFLASLPDTARGYPAHWRLQWMLHDRLFGDDAFLCRLLAPWEVSSPQQPEKADKQSTRLRRAQILADVAGTVDFSTRLKQACRELADAVWEGLKPFFPIINANSTTQESFQEYIINPAVHLAIKIHSSPTLYSFEPPTSFSKLGKGKRFERNDVMHANLIDAESGKAVQATSLVVADDKGAVGTEVAILVPSMLWHEPDQDPIRLTQEVILVAIDQHLRKRKREADESDEEGVRGKIMMCKSE